MPLNVETTIRSRLLKPVALLALAVMACAGLAGCGGGSAPGGGDEMVIVPRPSQGSPDLVVQSLLVIPDSPAAGARFTLSARVRNAGDGAAAATAVRFYRSTDATIAPSDDEKAGDAAVAELAASESAAAPVEVNAPQTPGTYYYGACADPVDGESDAANNCSAAVKVTVSATQTPAQEPQTPAAGRQSPSAGRPDLVVESPSADIANPTDSSTGPKFGFSMKVRNAGVGAASEATLRFYRSTDQTITTSDTPLGHVAVFVPAPPKNSALSVLLDTPWTPGTYYFGACVDPAPGESNTANNCSAAQVTVRERARPDLVVESPSVTNPNPFPEVNLDLSMSVRNAGNWKGEVAAAWLRVYRSTDATITRSDTHLFTVRAWAPAPSKSIPLSVLLTAPATPGTYYYGACTDAVPRESETANNCSPAAKVTVREPTPPDLVLTSASVGSANPYAGTSFHLQAAIRNNGGSKSAWSKLRFYRSTDATLTTSNTEIDVYNTPRMVHGRTWTLGTYLTAPSTPGTYYYGACVDAVAGESDKTNNCSEAVEVTVRERPPPDLQVVAHQAKPSNPAAGGSFFLRVSLRNTGGWNVPGATVRFYRSPDATIATSDTEVGPLWETSINGWSSSPVVSPRLEAPSTTGTYYYGACVGAVTGESDTTNNCSAGVKVTVREPTPPDLVLGSAFVNDARPAAGTLFGLWMRMRNAGDRDAAATTVRFYRSTDATITQDDTHLFTVPESALASSESSVVSVLLTAPSTPGTYYYGACVDAVTGETERANNCSAGVKVTVPEP